MGPLPWNCLRAAPSIKPLLLGRRRRWGLPPLRLATAHALAEGLALSPEAAADVMFLLKREVPQPSSARCTASGLWCGAHQHSWLTAANWIAAIVRGSGCSACTVTIRAAILRVRCGGLGAEQLSAVMVRRGWGANGRLEATGCRVQALEASRASCWLRCVSLRAAVLCAWPAVLPRQLPRCLLLLAQLWLLGLHRGTAELLLPAERIRLHLLTPR